MHRAQQNWIRMLHSHLRYARFHFTQNKSHIPITLYANQCINTTKRKSQRQYSFMSCWAETWYQFNPRGWSNSQTIGRNYKTALYQRTDLIFHEKIEFSITLLTFFNSPFQAQTFVELKLCQQTLVHLINLIHQ